MSDDLDLDPGLLTRYFAGMCSREEAQAFERWVAERPERQAMLEELRDARRIYMQSAQESYDVEAAWDKVRPAAPLRARPPLQLVVDRGPSAWIARRIAVAAGLFLAVGGAAWLTIRDRVGSPAASDYAVYATEHGGRRSVILGDGSRVVLGPRSRLRVAVNGTSAHRQVQLDGTAFFAVAHDPAHPFRVRAGGAEATVLGTEFTVRAYPDESGINVAVRSGRVAVRGGTGTSPTLLPPSILTPGQRARVTPGGAVVVDQLRDSSAFAWVDGPLRFESAQLDVLARELGRWLDIEITVDADLRSARATITLPELTRDSVLARLSRVTGARVTQHGDSVHVSRR